MIAYTPPKASIQGRTNIAK